MIAIAIERADGGVSLMRTLGPMNAQQIEAEVQRALLPSPPVRWLIVQDSQLPSRDEYRDAWRLMPGNAGVQPDMPKARELRRAQIRKARVDAMAALDAEYMKADENNDANKKRDVALKRQAWRDAPADPRIDAALTVEQLRAIPLPEIT